MKIYFFCFIKPICFLFVNPFSAISVHSVAKSFFIRENPWLVSSYFSIFSSFSVACYFFLNVLSVQGRGDENSGMRRRVGGGEGSRGYLSKV